ncbi:MAG: folate family ECF transporter S component [Treponema sp.]|jgi:ECF transporter S component (folate family)|nr:folate family ECF transporter S component [Treponema sp.]
MEKVKKLVLGSLLLATLLVVERLISIQTPILRISFAYVPLILSGILLGPGWSTAIAVLGDLLGMLLFPKGAYFAGYTISAALTGLVYGLFLYKTITISNRKFVVRLIISNLMVLIFISTGLTSLWIAITVKKAFVALLPLRVFSAAIRFPVETGTMFLLKVFLARPVNKYLYDAESVSAGEK